MQNVHLIVESQSQTMWIAVIAQIKWLKTRKKIKNKLCLSAKCTFNK
jgi:hypothetical protein